MDKNPKQHPENPNHWSPQGSDYRGWSSARGQGGGNGGRGESDQEYGHGLKRAAVGSSEESDETANPLERLPAMPRWQGYVNHPLDGGGERGPFVGRGPKGYARSDERIHEDVCERLTDAHDVDAGEITVTVSQGEVTLAGDVDGRAMKRRAEEIAESVRGVKDIHNQLKTRREP